MTHTLTSHPYFGVFVLFALTGIAFPATLWAARFVSHKLARKDTLRLQAATYECGPQPNKQPNSISVHFYLLALLFILFDVEIVFMIPWAIDFKLLGWFGFAEMLLFVGLLTIGFVYAWSKGALEWHSIK